MTKVVFLVLMTRGVYSERTTMPVRIYTEEGRARQFVDNKNAEMDRLEGQCAAYDALIQDWMDRNPSPGYSDLPESAWSLREDKLKVEQRRLSLLIFKAEVPPDSEDIRYYYRPVEQDPE